MYGSHDIKGRKMKKFWVVSDFGNISCEKGYECEGRPEWWFPEVGDILGTSIHEDKLFKTELGALIFAKGKLSKKKQILDVEIKKVEERMEDYRSDIC